MVLTRSSKIQQSHNKMIFLSRIFFVLFLASIATFRIVAAIQENFVQCMTSHSNATKNLYTLNSPLYSSILESGEQNPRWVNSTSLKPLFIITPRFSWEIQATVICSKEHGLRVRVRSGGHDYEGQSYRCNVDFIIIDLFNFRSIDIDMERETAWIQSGATLGELYYNIAKKSRVHGYPAGLCPSVGVGGHFSGGGIGTLMRKYGLAADNIIDAELVDVNGRLLDRKSMGEDLFWAIRGGGAASFGVITAWKVKLVQVPPMVTVFTIPKKMDHKGQELVFRWQNVASKFPQELFLRIIMHNVLNEVSEAEASPVEALFNSLFLGPKQKLMAVMKELFPELGLEEQDCEEMSWIESVVYFYGNHKRGESLDVLLNRTDPFRGYFKAKSDFLHKPIPVAALGGISERFSKRNLVYMNIDPLGGRLDEIPESETPFPHRKGNLFNIQYFIKWRENSDMVANDRIDWMKELYDYMEPYVCQSPRSAYLNYRDLDIGTNLPGKSSYLHAKIWGEKYFKVNFERLALTKRKVDPDNFFKNVQSIPPISQ